MSVLPPDPVFTLRSKEMGAVNSLCFHKNKYLLAGTLKGNIILWDLETCRFANQFSGGTEPILALHHTDNYLISHAKDGIITIWYLKNTDYQIHTKIETNYMGFCRSVLLKLSNFLCYPYEKNSIGIMHIGDLNRPRKILQPNETELPTLGNLMSFTAFEGENNQNYLIAVYESGHLLTWDVNSIRVIDVLKLESDLMVIDYDAHGNLGLVGGATNYLTAISYQRQTMKLQKLNPITIKNPGINCIRIRPDHKIFATGGWDSRIRIFSCNSLRPLAVLTEHRSGAIMDIAYSTHKMDMWQSPIMAAGGLDGVISLWNLYN